AEASALCPAGAGSARDDHRHLQHIRHPDAPAPGGAERALPAPIPRHPLLQPTALPAPAGADPHVRDGPEVLAAIESFGSRILGKGTVLARDVPGFIGNRLGVYGLLQAIRLMERFDLTIDEVDALTGPLIGRPRSATFRTADLSGLDVLRHVAIELSEATGEDFSLPGWVEALVEQGRLGEKSGIGFYRREGRDIFTPDWKTGEYHPRAQFRLPEIGQIQDLPL